MNLASKNLLPFSTDVKVKFPELAKLPELSRMAMDHGYSLFKTLIEGELVLMGCGQNLLDAIEMGAKLARALTAAGFEVFDIYTSR